eukprot:5569465-Karenia_brevis.AAC.1
MSPCQLWSRTQTNRHVLKWHHRAQAEKKEWPEKVGIHTFAETQEPKQALSIYEGSVVSSPLSVYSAARVGKELFFMA